MTEIKLNRTKNTRAIYVVCLLAWEGGGIGGGTRYKPESCGLYSQLGNLNFSLT